MATRRYLDHKLRLQLLRAVVAIDTNRSLLKAAAAIGISQPALTKNLQELEDTLQLRLFERHARGVRNTEAGDVFIRAARRILAELRRLDDELELLSVPGGGIVAIGALPVAASGILPGTLTRLKTLQPRLCLHLRQGRTEELLPLLAAGEIDLIVGRLYDPALPDGFDRQTLWTEPLSVLARAGHPLFAVEHVTADDLRRYELVLPTVTQRVGREIDHLLTVLGYPDIAALRSNSYGFIREMLHGTDLLSIMPRLMMAGDLVRGTLQVVPLPIATPNRPAGLIFPRTRPLQPAARAFVACLQSYVADLAERGIAEPITVPDT